MKENWKPLEIFRAIESEELETFKGLHVGHMTYCGDTEDFFVWDGDEWQPIENLPGFAKRAKADAKIDRRAAIAATKARKNGRS